MSVVINFRHGLSALVTRRAALVDRSAVMRAYELPWDQRMG